MGNKFCYESHAQATEQCLDVTSAGGIELYEWNTYTLSRTTLLGKSTVVVQVNGSDAATLSDATSNLRIWEEVDFVFGAAYKQNAHL